MTEFAPRLLRWFRQNKRDLPWRGTPDPYRIWLSEVMLQQTRVETVKPYFERFLDRFPTVEALAAAPLDDVLRLWAGLGYYSRARNLHAAAKVVVEKHAGRFPESSSELQTLPGVGRYTAAAIASIAFDEPIAVLDGNVKRVLARLFAIRESVDSPATTTRLWQLADSLVSRRSPGDFNQAMMELGATVCTPVNPLCRACPLQSLCLASARSIQHELPIKRKKGEVPHVRAVAAAIVRDNRVLLVQRPPRGLLGGMWELPGGALANGDSAGPELTRHIRRLLGVAVRVGSHLGQVSHQFTHRALTIDVFACTLRRGEPAPTQHTNSTWLHPAETPAVALATLDRKVLNVVQNRAVRTRSRTAINGSRP